MTSMNWDRERARRTLAQRRSEPDPIVPKTLAGSGCWCGGTWGHDWPGKKEGLPHPR